MKTTEKPKLQDFHIEGVKHINPMQGYPNVANLDGGLMLWKAKGLPFESTISSVGCGCNSGKTEKTDFSSLKLNIGEDLSKNIDFKNIKRI